jgi:hypothetical protein
MMYLTLGTVYPILLFILFTISSAKGSMMPFSLGAIIQPYIAANAIVSIILALAAVADIAVYYLMFYSKGINDPKNHLLLLTFPEVIGIFGFLIGVLNSNPWAAVPFFAIGFAIYAFVYVRISGQTA